MNTQRSRGAGEQDAGAQAGGSAPLVMVVGLQRQRGGGPPPLGERLSPGRLSPGVMGGRLRTGRPQMMGVEGHTLNPRDEVCGIACA